MSDAPHFGNEHEEEKVVEEEKEQEEEHIVEVRGETSQGSLSEPEEVKLIEDRLEKTNFQTNEKVGQEIDEENENVNNN